MSDVYATERTAMVTGVSGQDGAYLAKLLLSAGYTVVGTSRCSTHENLWRLRELGIAESVRVAEVNAVDSKKIGNLISDTNPCEIYNLAAQSSVFQSFKNPRATLKDNILSTTNILEHIRQHCPGTKFYQASSSEIFGNVSSLPIREDTPFNALSPYASSKAACHIITQMYRESFGLFSTCGILFNHESILRESSFFVKKIVSEIVSIHLGKSSFLSVGNLDVTRDFGSAECYVKAMWMMLQQPEPEDFIICSGQDVSLRLVVKYVLDYFGLDESVIRVDKALVRPNEIRKIYGSNEKASAKLGWTNNIEFFSVVDEMISYELKNHNQ